MFFQVGHGTMLGLYDVEASADVGAPAGAELSSSGTILSYNVDSPPPWTGSSTPRHEPAPRY